MSFSTGSGTLPGNLVFFNISFTVAASAAAVTLKVSTEYFDTDGNLVSSQTTKAEQFKKGTHLKKLKFKVPPVKADAGGKAIAIEAGKTIVVQRDQTLELARTAGITIMAIDDAEISRVQSGNSRRAA